MKESCLQVSRALEEVLVSMGFKIDVVEGVDGCSSQVIAIAPVRLASWGEIIRLRLLQRPDGLELAIRSERRLASNLTARHDWALAIYQALVRKLVDAS